MFVKGQVTNPNGRPVGALNAITAEIKDMVRKALDEAGGVSYLVQQASANPQAFMGLVGRCIPKDVNVKIKENPRIFVFPDNVTYEQVRKLADERERLTISVTPKAMDSLQEQSD